MIRPSAVATADRSSNRSFYGDNGEHRAPSVDRGVQVSSVVFLFSYRGARCCECAFRHKKARHLRRAKTTHSNYMDIIECLLLTTSGEVVLLVPLQ